MSEQTTAAPSQQHEGSIPPAQDLPTPPTLDSIRQRLTGEINIRRLVGTSLTPGERSLRDAEESASKAGRSEGILSSQTKEEAVIIDATIINSKRLKAWLDTRGLREFDDGPYHLETDPSQNIPGAKPPADSRIIDLMVLAPNFDLSYTLYQDATFDLRIDYTKWEGDERPQYRSGRQPIHGGLTSEEAEIIGVYAKDFLDTAAVAQKPAA